MKNIFYKILIFCPFFLSMLLLLLACRSYRQNQRSLEPSFIEATVRGRMESYHYNAGGIYDTATHVVVLKASDTAGTSQKTWIIRLQLGKNRLDKMQLPYVFYFNSDTSKQRNTYAQLIWDNGTNPMPDNYSYRNGFKLLVVLQSFERNRIKGTFSGVLLRFSEKYYVGNGQFSIAVSRK